MPTRSSSEGPGLLLLRGSERRAQAWVEHGTVPAHVVPLGEYVAVVPGGRATSSPPYDQAITVIANRQLPHTLRRALGFYVIGGNAVVVSHPEGLRLRSHWLVWAPEHGTEDLPDLPVLSERELLHDADVRPSGREKVAEVLRRVEGEPRTWLGDLVDALGLPGRRLLDHPAAAEEGAVLVTPSRRESRRFERINHEEKIIRDEMDGRA